jgi:HSP20 family protein
MDDTQSIHLKRLHGRLGEVVYQFTKIQFSYFSPPKGWSPAINAYRCDQQIVICVDLAGVERSQLDLSVQAGRLLLRGRREPPEPDCTGQESVQVLAMEIDFGPFEREIALPADIDAQAIRVEQNAGLLWIYLPLRTQS